MHTHNFPQETNMLLNTALPDPDIAMFTGNLASTQPWKVPPDELRRITGMRAIASRRHGQAAQGRLQAPVSAAFPCVMHASNDGPSPQPNREPD